MIHHVCRWPLSIRRQSVIFVAYRNSSWLISITFVRNRPELVAGSHGPESHTECVPMSTLLINKNSFSSYIVPRSMCNVSTTGKPSKLCSVFNSTNTIWPVTSTKRIENESNEEKERNNQISSGYYMWMVSKNKTNLILLRRGNIIKSYPFRVFLITVSSISSIPL